jgi:hypothetical protein
MSLILVFNKILGLEYTLARGVLIQKVEFFLAHLEECTLMNADFRNTNQKILVQEEHPLFEIEILENKSILYLNSLQG